MPVRLPKGEDKEVIQLTMDRRSRARILLTDLSTAQPVTLNTSTALIEINALDQPVYMRYLTASITAAVTNTNFDEFIQPGGVRHYVVPQGVTGLSLLQYAASGRAVVIEK